MKTSKSNGLDEISTFHLKLVKNEIAPIITQLVNTIIISH